jgi:hypothetical protein
MVDSWWERAKMVRRRTELQWGQRGYEWRSASTAGPDAIELARTEDGVAVRHGAGLSEGVVLQFAPQEWIALVDAVRAEEFDGLVPRPPDNDEGRRGDGT